MSDLVRFVDARAGDLLDGQLVSSRRVELGEAARAADVCLDASVLHVGAPIELEDVDHERLDVELVVAVGDLGHEEDFTVLALGAAMMRSHERKANTTRQPQALKWAAVALLLVVGRCKCGAQTSVDGGSPWVDAGDDVNVPRSADLEELWTHARAGDDDELSRLAAREGEHGLEERSAMPEHRLTALRAMAFAPGFSALPTLGAAAQHGTDDEARAAVESADAIAARKLAQADIDDEAELSAGCASLLAAAKNKDRSRPVRVGAVRAVRMLADAHGTHCVKTVDIPVDVDAR